MLIPRYNYICLQVSSPFTKQLLADRSMLHWTAMASKEVEAPQDGMPQFDWNIPN